MLFYKYKKSKFLLGLIGQWAFALWFSNQLLPKQSKKSCKCFIAVFEKSDKEKEKVWAENSQIFH